MEQVSLYVEQAVVRRASQAKRLSIHLGLALMLAAGSLLAVNSRGGSPPEPPVPVVVPNSGSACATPPNGFLYTKTLDGTTFQVCISQEGNINEIWFPDTAAGHTQIDFDGYCLLTDVGFYSDYSPSGPASSGWGPATMTLGPSPSFMPINVTRTTTDGKFQLSQFIKVNFQPRSIFVGMTVKSLDTTWGAHEVILVRAVAPTLDGSAADDLYRPIGIGGSPQTGRTGQAYHSPNEGRSSLLFGPTQSDGSVWTKSVAEFGNGCSTFLFGEVPGSVQVPPRVFVGLGRHDFVSLNQTVNLGKFVYRMG